MGEVERVICDHELGLAGARLRRLCEARREERAAAAGAAVGADGNLGPERLGRFDLELGAVARLGRGKPRLDRLVRFLVTRVAKQHRAEALELLAADVVRAALEHRDPHLAPERARRRRHLAGEQLLLERLRRGRDDDALPRLERGQQVGEALPRAGAGFGDEVLARRERELDRSRKRSLLRPGLEARERGGEGTAGTKRVVHEDGKPTEANGCSLAGPIPAISRPLMKIVAASGNSTSLAFDRAAWSQ